MNTTPFKIAAASFLTLAFASGTAFAGDGKDCKDKKHSAMKTQTTTMDQTAVLSASDRSDAMAKKTMKAKKVHSFDEALALCQEKAAADLQACIDYKTGVKAKPKS